MKRLRRYVLMTIAVMLVAAGLAGPAVAEWTATLQWSKVVVEGGLSYCDEGPFRDYYENHSLTRIEFYDWNGDPTGAALDFEGMAAMRWFLGPCAYLSAATWDSLGHQTSFTIFDRSGNTILEWTDPDSLNPGVELMQCGSGRFTSGRMVGPRQEDIRVYEPDGTMIASVTCDSVRGYELSGDGDRLYVAVGCWKLGSSSYPQFYSRVHVYDSGNGNLMFILPECIGYDVAAGRDVVALRQDSLMTVYRDGIAQGSLGNIGGVVGLSSNGDYAIGLTDPPNNVAAYRLDTMTLMWSIPDSLDIGEQLPTPEIADNGVSVYQRKQADNTMGITVVAPDGGILYDENYPDGAFIFLSGDGSFFVVERYVDDLVSYYSLTEE